MPGLFKVHGPVVQGGTHPSTTSSPSRIPKSDSTIRPRGLITQ